MIDILEQAITLIETKIKEASKAGNIHKIEGLVIAKYLLLGLIKTNSQNEINL
jgi:hypothetical protein